MAVTHDEAVQPALADPERSSYLGVVRAFNDVAEALVADQWQLDDLFRLVAAKVCELLGVQRCSLFLKDDRSDLFVGQIGYATSGEDMDARVKQLVAGIEADGFTREILRTRRPVLIRNASQDPRPVRATMRAWNIRAQLGVPMTLRGEIIGLLFLDDENELHPFDETEQEVAAAFANLAAAGISQAKLTAELRTNSRTMAHQNRALRQASVLEQRLTELVLEGADLQRIASAVAELSGRPCAIHDATSERVASGRPGDGAESQPPDPLETDYHEHPEIAEALRSMADRTPRVIGPFPGVGLHFRALLAPVIARDALWGHVVLFEQGSRFSAMDTLIARRAATIVALEMYGENRAVRAEWDASESLIGELLRGNRDYDALRRRAAFLGVDLEQPHALILVSRRHADGESLPSAREATAIYQSLHPGRRVLATGVPEGVLLMVTCPEDMPARSAIGVIDAAARRMCDEISAGGGDLVAGISTVCRQPDDFVGAYEEVRDVATLVDRLGLPEGNAVIAVDDLGAGRLLLVGVNRRSTERFVRDILGPLSASSDARTADLMATLCAFMDCSRSIRRCAEKLDVHENTVRYRIAKIEELIGLDVATDADAQLSVQIALAVLGLQGAAGTPLKA